MIYLEFKKCNSIENKSNCVKIRKSLLQKTEALKLLENTIVTIPAVVKLINRFYWSLFLANKCPYSPYMVLINGDQISVDTLYKEGYISFFENAE